MGWAENGRIIGEGGKRKWVEKVLIWIYKEEKKKKLIMIPNRLFGRIMTKQIINRYQYLGPVCEY